MNNNPLTKTEQVINYIPRKLEKSLKKYLHLPQIIAVVGPRRSGKTTFLKHMAPGLKNCSYISFENQKIVDLFDLDIESFARLYLLPNDNLIIDEFQYAKKGGKNLKFLFDFYPGKKIFISGSSSPDLTIRALRHLVGRALVFTLYPFDFEEFLFYRDPAFKNLLVKDNITALPLIKEVERYFEEYLLFGGYPEVVLEKNESTKKKLLENIYSLYFLREVRDLINLSDDYKLKNLIKGLALQIGNIISYQELSGISGFEFRSLKRYLNFLEKTFVSFFVPPYFKNKRTELTKNPKIYFFDTGLRNCVLDNFLPLGNRTDKGSLIENFVALQLKEKEIDLKFWRTKNKAEVDFIWEKEGKLLAAEVKAGIEKNIPPSLISFVEKYAPSHTLVINQAKGVKKTIKSTKISFVPYWQLKINF